MRSISLASRLAPALSEGTGAGGPRCFRPPLSFSLRFPPPSREEKTNKEEQIAGGARLSGPSLPGFKLQPASSGGVARERPGGASCGQRSERASREPCRAEGGARTASATTAAAAAAAGWGGRGGSHRYRRRLPGGRPSPRTPATQDEGFITVNGCEPMKLRLLKKDGQPIA